MKALLHSYLALSVKGQKKVGFLFASDLRHLKHVLALRSMRLQKGGCLPVWLAPIVLRLLKLFKPYRVNVQKRGIFFRQMANLISSGLSIQKVTETLIKQEDNKMLLCALCMLNENLNLGRDLSVSIQASFSFLPEEIRMLLSGCTDTQAVCRVFMAIATVSEDAHSMSGAIVRMLVTFSFFSVITVFIFNYYVRMWLDENRIGKIVSGSHITQAYETFYQLFSGQVFLNWRYFLLALIFCGIVFVVRRHPRLLMLWKRLMLHLPVIGEGIRSRAASSLFFYLSLQVNGGKTLHEALHNAVSMVAKTPYQADLFQMRDDLTNGKNITDAIEDVRVFSTDEKALLRSSFSSSSLKEALMVIRTYLDGKLETRTLILREFIRFVLIGAIVLMYAWAAYTIVFGIKGYV